MSAHVQFWRKNENSVDFLAQVPAITDPWETAHITLTAEKLIELGRILIEGGNDAGIQDQSPRWEEDCDSADRGVAKTAIQLTLC